MINEIIDEIIALRIPAIATVVASIVAFGVAMISIRKLSINGTNNRFAGFFVGLKDRSAFHFTFVWVKLMFFIFTLCFMFFQQAGTGHYLFIVATIVVSAFLAKEKKLIAMETFGGLLSLASVWVCNIFVEYINTIRTDAFVISGYWVVAAFSVLCSIVVFEFEVINISQEKQAYEENR